MDPGRYEWIRMVPEQVEEAGAAGARVKDLLSLHQLKLAFLIQHGTRLYFLSSS